MLINCFPHFSFPEHPSIITHFDVASHLEHFHTKCLPFLWLNGVNQQYFSFCTDSLPAYHLTGELIYKYASGEAK